jgi:dynein heavy chain
MVYVDPKNLGYKPCWDRWLKSRTGLDERAQLEELFVRYVDPQMKYIFEGQMGLTSAIPLKTVVPQTELNMVRMIVFRSVFITSLTQVTCA